jgi:hypothetical protein
MENLNNNNNNNNIVTEGAFKKYENDMNRLTMANDNMYHQARLYSKNVRDVENSNDRYWNAQINYNQIMNNERVKYDFFSHKAFSIINDINKPNQPIRLWRCGNTYYYRPTLFSDVIEGCKEEIAKEIASRYGMSPIN